MKICLLLVLILTVLKMVIGTPGNDSADQDKFDHEVQER